MRKTCYCTYERSVEEAGGAGIKDDTAVLLLCLLAQGLSLCERR